MLANFQSLENIINDILRSINSQIIENCNALKKTEAIMNFDEEMSKLFDSMILSVDGKECTVHIFKDIAIDSLIKGPLRCLAGRVNGLKKVVSNLRIQAEGIKKQVSTGN